MEKNSFTILETIRDGRLTRVLKAEQPSLKRTVLLKTLHKHLVTDANLVRRFEREARACAMIRSEHIVQVHDLIELDGAPTIVMEYVEGKSLQELLQEGVQSEQFARMVAASVLTALTVAHRAGVVHRDIKPSNIMIDQHGIIKVADFGLASIGVETTLTLEGTVLGTPAYMSPEQVSGGVIDGRSDLFSLGVTLLELVTGEKLFQGKSYAECLNTILNFKGESLDRFAGSFSVSFLTFVRRLMMPRKEDRFDSARDALRELTGEESASANRFSGPSRKFSVFSALIGVSVLVVLVIFILYVWPGANGNRGNEGIKYLSTSSEDSTKSDTLSASMSRETPQVTNISGDSQRTRRGSVPVGSPIQAPPTVMQERMLTQAPSSQKTGSDSGYVQISCTPWAKVFLGDEYIGTTPIAGSLKVKAGVHIITFNNPSFLPLVRSVTVQEGTLAHVEANFLEQVGYLLVVSQPWAEIYVDDQYRETTPLGQPLMVTSGNRKIRLHNPAFEDIVTTVTIGVRDTFKLVKSFSMK